MQQFETFHIPTMLESVNRLPDCSHSLCGAGNVNISFKYNALKERKHETLENNHSPHSLGDR